MAPSDGTWAIPAVAFLASSDIATRITTILVWGTFLPTLFVQVLRPELPEGSSPVYLEERGLSAGIRSLFKYRLTVSPRGGDVGGRRLSVSTLLFFLGFTFSASIWIVARDLLDQIESNNRDDLGALYGLLGAYAVSLLSFVGAMGRLIQATYDMKQSPTGWPIQDDERQVLAAVYGAGGINVMIASAVWFGVPLVLLITEKLQST